MFRLVGTSQGLPEPAKIWQNQPRFDRSSQDLTEPAKICQNLPRFDRTSQGLPEPAKIWQKYYNNTEFIRFLSSYFWLK